LQVKFCISTFVLQMKKDLKIFLKILLTGYAIVLGVNLIANYQYYAAGNDWHYSVIFCIVVTTLGCTGGMGIYKFSVRRADSKEHKYNLFISVLVSGVYGVVLMILVMKGMLLLPGMQEHSTEDYVMNSIWAALFSMLISLIIMGQEVLKRLRNAMIENEQMKQEMIRSQFETLKNQVNPHFLFNSLNTLTAIIPEKPEVAVDFVQQLSKVFRYSLQYSGENTIDIGQELKIVEAYLFVNKQRYDGKLISEINVSDETKQKKIITQALLMLVENAIKHNEISNIKPLTIVITEEGNNLAVKNSLQRKAIPEPSTGMGINNIVKRYELVSDIPVMIKEENNWFIVKLPLLEK